MIAPTPSSAPIIQTQTIIKTKTVTVPVKAKPKDPLLVMIDEQRYAEALNQVNFRLQHNPTNPTLHFLKAEILTQRNSYPEAEAEYNWILGKPKFKALWPKAASQLGMTQLCYARQLRNSGNSSAAQPLLQEAQASFTRALKYEPRTVTAIARTGPGRLAAKSFAPKPAP